MWIGISAERFFMFRFMHERYNSPLYPLEGMWCEQAQHWKSIFLSFVDVLKLFYLFLLNFFYKHFVRDSFIFAIYWEANTVNYPTIMFNSTKYCDCWDFFFSLISCVRIKSLHLFCSTSFFFDCFVFYFDPHRGTFIYLFNSSWYHDSCR